jgi:hypothetical protein
MGIDQSPDAEVRMRCELLLPRVEAADHVARVAVFVADVDGKFRHEVAGWEPFRKAVGDDRDARRLFARIATSAVTRDVLVATRRPGPALQSLAEERWARLYADANPPQVEGVPAVAGRPPNLSEVAALLLADIASPVTDDGFGTGWIPTLFLSQESPLAEAAHGRGPDGPAFRRLVVAWLDTKSGTVGLQHATQIATALQLPAAVRAKYHAKSLGQKGLDAYTKVASIGVLAASGDRTYLAALERLRNDNDELPIGLPDGASYSCRVGDMALAAMIHLSGQSLTDYGYTSAPGGPIDFNRVDACRFAPDRKGTTEEKRERAATKWDEWARKSNGK